MPRMLLVALTLSACEPTKEPVDTVPEPSLDFFHNIGPAPWDGLVFEIDPTDLAATPTVLDADGAAVDLEIRDTPYVNPPLWGAPEGLAPGDYRLVGWDGADRGFAETFTVEDYGVSASFDPSGLAGKVYTLDLASVWMGGLDVAGLAPEHELLLAISNIEGETADFSLIHRADGASCVVLQGDGTMDAQGLLTYTAASLEMSTSPSLIAEDITFSAGFSPDGERIAGAQARLWVDTRLMSAHVYESADPEALCQAWQDAFGATCEDCGDGVRACVDFGFYGGQWSAVETEIETEAETCTVLIEEDLIPACSCASTGRGGVASLAVGLAIALLRRRPRQNA